MSNILPSVSILVYKIGKSSVKKEGEREDIEVNLNEDNVTLGSALYILTDARFETGVTKPRKYLFGAILYLSMEMVFGFSVKDVSLSVLIAISFLSVQHDY